MRKGEIMGSIRIISTVDESGKLHIPEELKLEKGNVEVIIKPLDEIKNDETLLSFSDHTCGRLLIYSLRREDIYGNSER